jgi:uncharacterized protein YeaO (DUF488 family)
MKKYRSEILSKLSPVKIYEELVEMMNRSSKQRIALLCYEKPDEVCHRRFIAEWLEAGNSVSVLEYAIEEEQLSLI